MSLAPLENSDLDSWLAKQVIADTAMAWKLLRQLISWCKGLTGRCGESELPAQRLREPGDRQAICFPPPGTADVDGHSHAHRHPSRHDGSEEWLPRVDPTPRGREPTPSLRRSWTPVYDEDDKSRARSEERVREWLERQSDYEAEKAKRVKKGSTLSSWFDVLDTAEDDDSLERIRYARRPQGPLGSLRKTNLSAFANSIRCIS